MGIDIYMRWPDQSEGEAKAQLTGFSTEAGYVGYLREAYHGAPYATRHFVREAFENDPPQALFRNHVLEERLADTMILAIAREARLYHQGSPGILLVEDDQSLEDVLKERAGAIERLFSPAQQATDELVTDTILQAVTDEDRTAILAAAKERKLPPCAMAYYDFWQLAVQKETQTGKPVTVVASY